jgi:adenosylcobinamide-GDP ribazoletransferase
VIDSVRLAVGTLTAFRVTAPRNLSPKVAGRAMLLAPVVGLLLAVIAEAFVVALRWKIPGGAGSLLASAVGLAVLALLTRGIHLDGLADTADALGSGRPAAEALEVMKRSDVGAFGVMSVALVLLVQVGGLNTAVIEDRGTLALVGGTMAGRLAMSWACMRGVPAARTSGLGATVAGSVSVIGAALMTVLTGLFLAFVVWVDGDLDPAFTNNAEVSLLVALIVGGLFIRHCVRRFGGITGDVLGAVGEVTFAVFAALICIG